MIKNINIEKTKDQDSSNSTKNDNYEEESLLRLTFPEFIGHSKAMQQVLKNVLKISQSNSSVLIIGESGTGKELIASAIHRLSQRTNKYFVAINCSAIPEQLLEAELLGHEKGAFTGADKKRIGHIGRANKGSLFLDEIGDMPIRLQAKILRVIQEKKYSSLGSSEVQNADIRFIAATNKNLHEAINENLFRLDLYYRLNVLNIKLPPLRKRPEDIIPLIKHFLAQLIKDNKNISNTCSFDKKALDLLTQYQWPGNIRQLHNVIERLVLIKEGNKITEDDIEKEIFPNNNINFTKTNDTYLHNINLPSVGINLPVLLESIENDLIKKALIKTENNKNKAAILLGLNRTTLVEKIKKRKISITNSK